MANQNKPFGLAPVRTVSSSTYNGQTTRYYIYASDTDPWYIGDACISAAQGDATGTSGIAKATGAQTLRGVVIGFEPANQLGVSIAGPALSLLPTLPATKTQAYYAYVVDDPMAIFSIQGDGTATNQVATNSNKNFSLTIANGATTSSASGTVMASASIQTTNSLNMKAIGLLQIPGNAYGAYAVWQCKINLHELSASGTTAI